MKLQAITPAFVDSLAAFRFTGDVRAMPEGPLFFPHEPILQDIAPISEAQLVEIRVINLLQFQVLIAGEVARCVAATPKSLLVDVGLWRAPGAEAGLLAARAAYIGDSTGPPRYWPVSVSGSRSSERVTIRVAINRRNHASGIGTVSGGNGRDLPVAPVVLRSGRTDSEGETQYGTEGFW
ncbi:MAG: hypothetical protein LJE91_01175 [Gammaproteobacteria bacterium]|nr:hypothetical protein [Gammaproteobacteria bacterium]